MAPARHARGFTLVELLVALFAMALLAVMSWRGLDGMARAQAATATRADEVLTLQVGLAQWGADLDAVVQLPGAAALDWNGRVLRLTRRDTTNAMSGVLVAAWTARSGQWLRWQSPPLTTRGQLDQAWLQADQWSQNAGDEERRREVAVIPLQEWKIFYFRRDAWTNPQSSDAGSAPVLQPGLTPEAAAALAAQTTPVIPDGVRLVLVLPPGGALAGQITRDWVRPTIGGGKS
ncbi:type II secretion system protein J [Caenimonas terrae]|uniref:Type II secretion system protein J n=1 Tax=Caenimonas terrae TaxID=696074 RepID=A0ABW0N8E1_9BURK